MVSILFVLADAFYYITCDSALLGSYFDNNSVVWVFFLSVSVTAKAIIITFVFKTIVSEVLFRFSRLRVIYLFFALDLIILMVPMLIQLHFYIQNGYGNSSLDFLAQYIAPFIVVLSFADMYWPIKKISAGTDINSRIDDLRFEIGNEIPPSDELEE